MEFIVNQKLVSLTGKYFIKDKSGNDVFVVKGSFSLPRKFRVFDMQGKEIVCVKKRMFRLLENSKETDIRYQDFSYVNRCRLKVTKAVLHYLDILVVMHIFMIWK